MRTSEVMCWFSVAVCGFCVASGQTWNAAIWLAGTAAWRLNVAIDERLGP